MWTRKNTFLSYALLQACTQISNTPSHVYSWVPAGSHDAWYGLDINRVCTAHCPPSPISNRQLKPNFYKFVIQHT